MSQSIKYRIKFYSDWHCGSGLSAGADSDSLVIKDGDKLPFIPGKTMKGLIRESVEEIQGFEKTDLGLIKIFGAESEKNTGEQGVCFFTNVCLKNDLKDVIVDEKLQEYMYRDIASTSIDDKGVAVDHSLRKMEVTIPCELEGEIFDVPDDCVEIMKKGLKFIKRLGQNRNRGLGRCSVEIIGKGVLEEESS